MKNNQKKIKKSFFAAFALILIFAIGVTTAAAETSVVWSKNIGDVTAADMSEDGSVIYAAVGSQVFVYDSAGVQQNTFTVGGPVVKLVCTADGTRVVLSTDGNEVYYINNGQITWNHTFTAITDIDISNAGNVLIVESSVFHKYRSDGSVEYDSTTGTYTIGSIDSDDEFAIIQSSNTDLQKYILSSSNNYWGVVNNRTFNTAFQNYQNVLILYTNETSAIILNNQTLGDDVWNEIYNNLNDSNRYFAISDESLSQTNPYSYYDSIFSWERATASAAWSSRSDACAWVYDNRMWIGGGRSGNTFFNDIWYSTDGVTWTRATASAAWSGRWGACAWVYNNRMWIGGGKYGTGSSNNINDVWYSTDGVTWTSATSSAAWSGRYAASAWVYNNRMWIGGGKYGTGSSNNINDVWYSTDGATWTRSTASAAWSARYSACAWVYNNRMWIGGGNQGGSISRDVWYSTDGVTWTSATSSAAWSGRWGACAWVYNNRMWIGGGYASGTTYRDVWYSTDGATWTRSTASAAWSARYSACAWVYDNRMWIGGGGGGESNVWMYPKKSVSDSYLIINPISNPTYVFYNYIGSSPQHIQTSPSGAVDFNGTYELRSKPTLNLYALQTTKTYTGSIEGISLSDRGDWLGVLTASKIYHDQITNAGFGTSYSDTLGSTGTAYDIATANSAAMSIVGQGQITDIYSMTTTRVGTYTAGGAVTHVDIADKNALWAASGGEDGKVYVFSKDESSNWYLEYSSDSEDPITALRMSSRGEFVLAGRTGSLTLYQTNTPQQTTTDFWLTLYVYKDSDSYRNAAVNVSVYTNNQWTSFAQGLTDSAGKYVVMVTAGQNYKFDIDNGQKLIIYQASPSVTSLTASIYSTPISSSLTYEAEWDPETNSITFDYHDSAGQTQSVTVRILRTDNWDVVYENTFTNQQSIEQNLPMIDDTVTYKVEMSAQRVSGLTRNTFFVSSSRDIVSIPLDQNLKNILFTCFLIFIAGLFSYYSAVRGPIVVAFMAVLFVYMGWLTIPWYWVTVAVVIAILAAFTQRR